MREIKFKAWDGEEMLSDINPSSVPLGVNDLIRGTTLEVMQFTGLKDKNGKEIYEGDIVRWNVGTIRTARVSQLVVEWNDKEQGFLPYINQTSEVIGNIYENPELIK